MTFAVMVIGDGGVNTPARMVVDAPAASGPTVIRDAECAGVSFPDFYKELNRMVDR